MNLHLRRYALFALVLLITGLVVWGLYSFGFIGRASPSNISTTAVVREIRELARFETASFTIEKIIDAGTPGNGIKEMLFGDRILLIAKGDATAGFDLSTMKDGNIVINGAVITLNLPAPIILTSRLDNDATRVYDRKLGLLTTGDKNLESVARATAEQAIKSAACTNGILVIASQNGRKQLSALLGSLGFTSVIINIPESGC